MLARLIYAIVAFICFMFAFELFANAKSAIHEIEALVSVCAGLLSIIAAHTFPASK